MHPQLPQLSPINKIFIVVSVVVFILLSLTSLAGIDLLRYVALSVHGLKSGFVQTLFTFPFAETQLIAVLFNCLILWFLGSEIEFHFGPRNYLSLVGLSFLGGALVFLTVSALVSPLSWLAGAGSLSSGLCVVYALLYPDRQFVFMLLFPMRAKYFCLILIAVSLYQGIFSGSRAQALAQLGAMTAVWLMMGLKFGQWGPWRLKRRELKRMSKAKLKLVKKDDDDTPKYWH